MRILVQVEKNEGLGTPKFEQLREEIPGATSVVESTIPGQIILDCWGNCDYALAVFRQHGYPAKQVEQCKSCGWVLNRNGECLHCSSAVRMLAAV